MEPLRIAAKAPHQRPSVRAATGVINAIAHSSSHLQTALDSAEAQVRAAIGARSGVRITRRSVSLFTVEAAADVPRGTIVEIDCGQRPAGTLPWAAGDEEVL
jgi:hypothetical protein